jgi:16S rRNA (cytosine967-C5)-methyltransferase
MIAEVRMKQAEQALQRYQPEKDLNQYLKAHLKQFPKMGSKDRREVSSLVYDTLRVHQLFPGAELRKRIWLGSVLCATQAGHFAHYWTEQITGKPLPELTHFEARLTWLADQGFLANWEHFFPYADQISDAIDLPAFYAAHLVHPITWVRVKQRSIAAFRKELDGLKIEYQQHELLPSAFALKSGVKLDQLKSWQNGALEVQDLSSQQVAGLFEPKAGERWLDACAGSGGKSLLLHDLEPEVSLFVTDIREEILQRLHERFKRAGIRSYSRAVVDFTKPMALNEAGSFPRLFDVVLADVPCSGSGTWSSTPEMLITQRQLQLAVFAERQLAIAKNALSYVKSGGRFIYLTCSVYKAENETIVAQLAALPGISLVQQQYFQTSAEGGDVLFGAVLSKKT